MASEQEGPEPLPSQIEEWVADRTAETGDSRETVLARAVATYRLLADGEDEDDVLETELSELEARIEALESESESESESETSSDRIEELETELDEHVEDLRSRIVDVVKEARSRAPADHSHEAFEDRLTELETGHERVESTTEEVRETTETLETEVEALEEMAENRLKAVEGEVGSATESVTALEEKANRLAKAVLDLRRRLQRVESHITHQTALAELLETAAREDIEKARCDNCNETVKLGMLVEPACPHCRSVFEGIEPGSMFFKAAWLTIADRPALEAGSTTEEPFDASETEQAVDDSQPHRDER